MLKKTFLFMILLFTVSIFAEENKKSENKAKVLLAFEKTSFKSDLIDEMKKRLEKSGIEITVKEHSQDGLNAKAADFNAVFITNSGVRSQVRPWIVKWLTSNKKQKDIILLHTTQTRDWEVKAEVDTVTSASSSGDVKKLAEEYVNRIKKIIKK